MLRSFSTFRGVPTFLVIQNLLLRWGLPLAALLASAGVGLLAARRPLLAVLPLALVAGGAGMVILLRWPGVGFPVFILAALLVPFEVGTGTGTTINAAVIVVAALIGLWGFHMVASERRITIAPSRPLLPLFLLMLSTLISLAFGQLAWFSRSGASMAAQLGGVGIFLLSGGAFFLAAHRLERRWLRWMVGIFLTLGILHMVGILFPYLPVRRLAHQVFQRGVLDSQFWLWITVLAFGQMVANRRLPGIARLGLGAAAVLSLYITLVTKQAWTSGWLPALVGAGVILFLHRPKLALVLGAVMAALLLIRSQMASEIIMSGDNTYSLMTRLEAWKILFEMIKRNPLFGLGPSNYYYFTPFFSILGYNVSFNSHNNYVDLLAQTGIVGLGLFLWFAVEMGRVCWKMLTRVPEGFDRGFVYGAIGGLAGMLVAGMFGDWVLPFVYNVGFDGLRASLLGWLFLGAVVRYEQEARALPEAAEG